MADDQNQDADENARNQAALAAYDDQRHRRARTSVAWTDQQLRTHRRACHTTASQSRSSADPMIIAHAADNT